MSREKLAQYLQAAVALNIFLLFTIVAVGVAGFAVGLPISGWPLLIAAVVAITGSRIFLNSWREVALISFACAIIHAAALGLAAVTYDAFWDGLTYHQEAVLRMVAGWNPLFDTIDQSELQYRWLNHYPKGAWIAATTVFSAVGRIEAAKLFSPALIVTAASQVAVALLRLTSLRLLLVLFVSALVALNPIAILQATTFCVDGTMGSLLTIATAGLILYVFRREPIGLVVPLLALCLAINLKFTGTWFATVLLAAVLLIMICKREAAQAMRLSLVFAIAAIVSVLLLGYAPYVRNVREKHAIFYPLLGANHVDVTTKNRPANLVNKDRFSAFLIANFSRSEFVRTPQSTRLKFPFLIFSSEWNDWFIQGLEAGGFGPLYSGLLLLGALGLGFLFANQTTRQTAMIVSIIGATLLVTIFGISECAVARWFPQSWLLPAVVAVGCILVASPARWIGWAMLGLMCLNVLFVGYCSSREQWIYARETRRCLREISPTGPPITAFLGPFLPLRERLREAGAQVQVMDPRAEVPPGMTKHLIPAPRAAFWTDQAPGLQTN